MIDWWRNYRINRLLKRAARFDLLSLYDGCTSPDCPFGGGGDCLFNYSAEMARKLRRKADAIQMKIYRGIL